VSLRNDLVRLDAQIAELTPDQRAALRVASIQIAAALKNLSLAIPDGTTSPIAATIEGVMLSAAFTYRPGKGFAGLGPKMAGALEECGTLRTVMAELVAKLSPTTAAPALPAALA